MSLYHSSAGGEAYLSSSFKRRQAHLLPLIEFSHLYNLSHFSECRAYLIFYSNPLA